MTQKREKEKTIIAARVSNLLNRMTDNQLLAELDKAGFNPAEAVEILNTAKVSRALMQPR